MGSQNSRVRESRAVYVLDATIDNVLVEIPEAGKYMRRIKAFTRASQKIGEHYHRGYRIGQVYLNQHFYVKKEALGQPSVGTVKVFKKIVGFRSFTTYDFFPEDGAVAECELKISYNGQGDFPIRGTKTAKLWFKPLTAEK